MSAMKWMTIMLAGMLLLLGASPDQSLAEESYHGGAAMVANDAGLSLEGLRRDQELFYGPPRNSAGSPAAGSDRDKGFMACHLVDGCGYTVNPQVMIELQYSIVNPEPAEAAFANNDVAGDRFAPNFMVGFSYHF